MKPARVEEAARRTDFEKKLRERLDERLLAWFAVQREPIGLVTQDEAAKRLGVRRKELEMLIRSAAILVVRPTEWTEANISLRELARYTREKEAWARKYGAAQHPPAKAPRRDRRRQSECSKHPGRRGIRIAATLGCAW
jgi:hypothetical protein